VQHVSSIDKAARIVSGRRIRLSVERTGGSIFPSEQLLLSSASQQWEGFLIERHLGGDGGLPEHRHSGIALMMQLDSGLRLQWKSGSNWQSVTAGEGSIVLHGSSGSKESTWHGKNDRLSFEMTSTHLEKLTEGRFAGGVIDCADHWSLRDPRLEHLLKVLHAELQQGAPAGRLFGEQVGDAIGMLLARQYATVKVGAYGTGGGISAKRLKQVLDYIEAHLDQQTHLSDLAEAASMSPFYFAHLFKNSMGVSPHKYVTMRRIERAKKMLHRSDMSVLEIGIRVGYQDAKHFRVMFRREAGVSPSEFRASQS